MIAVMSLSACGNAAPSPSPSPATSAVDTQGLLACQLLTATGDDAHKLMNTATITDIAAAAAGSSNGAIKQDGAELSEKYEDAAGNLGTSDEESSAILLVSAADVMADTCVDAGLVASPRPS